MTVINKNNTASIARGCAHKIESMKRKYKANMTNTKVKKKPNFLFDGSLISENFKIFFFLQQASL